MTTLAAILIVGLALIAAGLYGVDRFMDRLSRDGGWL